MSVFCLLVMFAAHRMRNLTTSSLKNTIFLFHFSATQNSNSCRNSAYMARKKMAGRTYMGVYRTTFITDTEGTVTRIIGPKEVKVRAHAEQIL